MRLPLPQARSHVSHARTVPLSVLAAERCSAFFCLLIEGRWKLWQSSIVLFLQHLVD